MAGCIWHGYTSTNQENQRVKPKEFLIASQSMNLSLRSRLMRHCWALRPEPGGASSLLG